MLIYKTLLPINVRGYMQAIKYFDSLYREKNQINLLNWAYLILVAIGTICSAIIAIFSQSLGAALLIVPILSLVAICLNIFMWHIIENIVKKKEKSKIYQIILKLDKTITRQSKKTVKKSNAKRQKKSSR